MTENTSLNKSRSKNFKSQSCEKENKKNKF